jgi:hypothetical protein
MPLLFGHDATVAKWVEERMDGVFVMPHVAIGMLDKNGVLRGGFVLTVHNASTAELTLYSEDVVTNGMVRGFFQWCFGQLGVHRLQIRTERTNKKAKRAAPKMGFKFEGVAREFYGPGEDALLFYMTPDHCRWIKTNGKPIQNAQSASTVGREAKRVRSRRAKPEERQHGVGVQPA